MNAGGMQVLTCIYLLTLKMICSTEESREMYKVRVNPSRRQTLSMTKLLSSLFSQAYELVSDRNKGGQVHVGT